MLFSFSVTCFTCKMSDEEFFMLLVITAYLLQQNRQRSLQRMIAFVAEYIKVRNLQMQQAAVQFFANAYNDREVWAFHRQYNEFDVYYNSDLNTSKDLDPNYWTTHYRVSRETFDYICSAVRIFMEKDETNMRDTIPVP